MMHGHKRDSTINLAIPVPASCSITGRLLATLLFASAVVQAGFAAPQDDVDRAEEARYVAMIAKNRSQLADSLADEFIYHQPTGLVMDKSGYLDQVMGPAVKFVSAERYEVKTQLYDNVAVVTGSTKVDLELKGDPKHFDIRFLNVWIKRNDRWLLAARQSAFKSSPK